MAFKLSEWIWVENTSHKEKKKELTTTKSEPCTHWHIFLNHVNKSVLLIWVKEQYRAILHQETKYFNVYPPKWDDWQLTLLSGWSLGGGGGVSDGGASSGGWWVERLYVTLCAIFHPSFFPTRKTLKRIATLLMSCVCSSAPEAILTCSTQNLTLFKRHSGLFKDFTLSLWGILWQILTWFTLESQTSFRGFESIIEEYLNHSATEIVEGSNVSNRFYGGSSVFDFSSQII